MLTVDSIQSGSVKIPPGWASLWINTTTTGAKHLCDRCAPLLKDFMEADGQKIE